MQGSSRQFEVLIPNDALRERFLTQVQGEDLQAKQKVLEAAIDEAAAWCKQFSTITNPTMIPPIALLGSIQFPDLSSDRLATIVELISWVYAFDDFIDMRERTVADISQVAHECFLAGAFDHRFQSTNGQYACALSSIRERLTSWQLFRPLEGAWVMCLSRLIDGLMIQGKAARLHLYVFGAESIEQYLLFSSHGIGFPLLTATGLMGFKNPDALQVLPQLLALAEQCGIMTRLANDLRSFQQDLVDGSLNVLSLTGIAGHGVPVADWSKARATVLNRMREARTKGCTIAGELGEFEGVGMRFLRTADFAVEIFREGDLRSWATGHTQVEGD